MLGITKEQLKELPEVQYPGRVIMVNTAAKAKSALRYLNKVKQVGFDTETRPSFQKNHRYKVSLVQISTLENECFLFRLKEIGSLDGLFEFFENPEVQKIGLSLKDDFHSLAKLRAFTPAGFVELQTFVKNYKIADNSLQKIYGLIFNERISKNQRLTNWEAKDLTEGQQAYAALDAWACQRIYNHLIGNKFNPDECEYVIDDETAEALQRSVGIHLQNTDGTAPAELISAEPAKKKKRKKKKSPDADISHDKEEGEIDENVSESHPNIVNLPAETPKKTRYRTHTEEISELKERLSSLESLVSEVKEAIQNLIKPKAKRTVKKKS